MIEPPESEPESDSEDGAAEQESEDGTAEQATDDGAERPTKMVIFERGRLGIDILGIKIRKVIPDTQAAHQGVEEGDVITGMSVQGGAVEVFDADDSMYHLVSHIGSQPRPLALHLNGIMDEALAYEKEKLHSHRQKSAHEGREAKLAIMEEGPMGLDLDANRVRKIVMGAQADQQGIEVGDEIVGLAIGNGVPVLLPEGLILDHAALIAHIGSQPRPLTLIVSIPFTCISCSYYY
jgi:C-terminal processing protease CtpA/Prc